MSEEKHTPGPWETGGYTITARGGRMLIAKLYRAQAQDDFKSDANARLIAAAPDLLTACRHLTGQLALLAKDPSTNPWVKQGLAAIAKAEGRTS